ncbi:MAG: Flp pilus assembly complex ATPase component TadA [Clostridia bacterium]|nr:Flp pilus assembly complex ATPase component TadA [Clostridia bacterium]
MTKDQKFQVIKYIAEYFPQRIQNVIDGMSDRVKNDITEIRLRIGRPLTLTLKGENVFVDNKGQVCFLKQHGLLIVERRDLDEIFEAMCGHSEYVYTEQIKNGYISLKYGCRAGLAASAVYENGEIINFTQITSINIRIASEYIGCAASLSTILSDGLLIAGPPASGKTTVLRDGIRMLSDGDGMKPRRVAVIDTRREIAAVGKGIVHNDLGTMTDVISECEKVTGIEIALRTLNPEVIAFDEIADFKEAKAVLSGFNSGVNALTTVHIGCVDDLLKRDVTRALLTSGVIKNVALLKGIGQPIDIISVEELLKESNSKITRSVSFA